MRELSAGLKESQIYRIDHYLGKETVQNILAFRFANGIFEPIWNRRYVDHVQMTVAEDAGIGTRGSYYDKAGALRDIVQNHMFQLLTLVAMEPPISFRANDVQDEKVKVLHAIQPFTRRPTSGDTWCAAQYEGYREEPNVRADSRTETFVAHAAARRQLAMGGRAVLPADRQTAGEARHRDRRALQTRAVDAVPRHAGRIARSERPAAAHPAGRGHLALLPCQGSRPVLALGTVTMDFNYAEYFNAEPVTGYETLLFDAMAGDQTLFHRMDIVEAGWQVVDPILHAWAAIRRSPLHLRARIVGTRTRPTC